MKTELEVYKDLLGREPTDVELNRLLAIREKLGIRQNDAFFLLIIAMEYYRSWYISIPSKIETACKEASKDAALGAEAEVNKAVARLVPGVTEELKKAVEESKVGVTMASLIGGIVCCGLVLAFGLMMGFDLGRQSSGAPRLNWLVFAERVGWAWVVGILIIAFAILWVYMKRIGVEGANFILGLSVLGFIAVFIKFLFF
jgi:hypothetical protein